MTIEKIIEYVSHTPHNTNTNILRQMLGDLANGAVSWNDLIDKPFGLVEKNVSVFENVYFNYNQATIPFVVIEGETYAIVIDGESFSGIAQYDNEMDAVVCRWDIPYAEEVYMIDLAGMGNQGKAGICISGIGNDVMSFTIVGKTVETKLLDAQYMSAPILTSESGMKFRLMVEDDGSLFTEEVEE